MRYLNFTPLILVLLVILLACSESQPPTNTLPSPTLQTASATPEPTVSPTPTNTPLPPTAQPSPTAEPTATLIQPTATATPLPANLQHLGNSRYLNPLYGVGLELSDGWTISRHSSEHHFDLRNGAYRLVVMPRGADGAFAYPHGVSGAGTLLLDEAETPLVVLDQPAVRRYLTYEGERRIVYYTTPDNELIFEAGERGFSITVAKEDERDLTTDEAQTVIAEADQIIQSLFVETPSAEQLTLDSRLQTYRDPDFGLSLTVPEGWELTRDVETTNIVLRKDEYMLLITMRNAELPAVGGRTGTGAGEFISVPDEPPIYGLGQLIARRYLTFEGRRKMVTYVGVDDGLPLTSGAFEAFITFDLYEYEDYREVDLSDEIVAEADQIIASLWLAEQYQAEPLSTAFVPTQTVYSTHVFTSTNGAWVATATSFEPFERVAGDVGTQQHRQQFVVKRVDESADWVARDVLENWGIGVGYYAPLLWTDEVLYFTYRPIPGGCGNANGSDLWSLNLNNGTVEQLAPSLLRFGIRVSLTQTDDLRFAFNTEQGFAVRRPNSEQLINYRLNIPDLDMAGLYWTPDGSHLLIIDGGNSCASPERVQRIFVVHLAEERVEFVTSTTGITQTLQLREWLTGNVALLEADGQIFTLDLDSGERQLEPPVGSNNEP